MDLCRKTSCILNTDAPERAVAVKKPAIKECPANFRSVIASLGDTHLHQPRHGAIRHGRGGGRSHGPRDQAAEQEAVRDLAMLDPGVEQRLGSQPAPSGMAMVAPAPSWSVLLRRTVTRSPSLTHSTLASLSASSSERRNAPAMPKASSARSRTERRSSPTIAYSTSRSTSASAACFLAHWQHPCRFLR